MLDPKLSRSRLPTPDEVEKIIAESPKHWNLRDWWSDQQKYKDGLPPEYHIRSYVRRNQITDRYDELKSYAAVGKEFDLSGTRVSQIVILTHRERNRGENLRAKASMENLVTFFSNKLRQDVSIADAARAVTDDFFLRMPNNGKKALRVMRETYGDYDPEIAAKFWSDDLSNC